MSKSGRRADRPRADGYERAEVGEKRLVVEKGGGSKPGGRVGKGGSSNG